MKKYIRTESGIFGPLDDNHPALKGNTLYNKPIIAKSDKVESLIMVGDHVEVINGAGVKYGYEIAKITGDELKTEDGKTINVKEITSLYIPWGWMLTESARRNIDGVLMPL